MMWTVSLIICALFFGGVMERAGMLSAIANKIPVSYTHLPFVIDIMKKYEELNLPDYEFLPDNSVFVNCIPVSYTHLL